MASRTTGVFPTVDLLTDLLITGALTALLLADGGYAPSNPPEWIAALHPQLVLLSVGAEGKRSLPLLETLEAAR